MAQVLLLSLFSVLVSVALSDLTRIEHPLKNDESLALLVIGDWGRKGNYNQSLVAEQVLKVFPFFRENMVLYSCKIIPTGFFFID
jgi:tartrate-resistant acid phosphatase type 5